MKITTKEVSERLGKSHRTVRYYCKEGILKCEKIGRNYYIDEQILDDFMSKIKFNVKGKQERAKVVGKGIAYPPYILLAQRNGYLEAQVDIFQNQIEELKATINLLQEQLTYQKTSWIRKLFKR